MTLLDRETRRALEALPIALGRDRKRLITGQRNDWIATALSSGVRPQQVDNVIEDSTEPARGDELPEWLALLRGVMDSDESFCSRYDARTIAMVAVDRFGFTLCCLRDAAGLQQFGVVAELFVGNKELLSHPRSEILFENSALYPVRRKPIAALGHPNLAEWLTTRSSRLGEQSDLLRSPHHFRSIITRDGVNATRLIVNIHHLRGVVIPSLVALTELADKSVEQLRRSGNEVGRLEETFRKASGVVTRCAEQLTDVAHVAIEESCLRRACIDGSGSDLTEAARVIGIEMLDVILGADSPELVHNTPNFHEQAVEVATGVHGEFEQGLRDTPVVERVGSIDR